MIDVVYFQVCVTARSWHGTSGSLSSLSPRPGRLTKDLVTVANALETRKRRRPVEDFGGRVKDCSLTPKSFRTLSPVKDTQSMKKGGGHEVHSGPGRPQQAPEDLQVRMLTTSALLSTVHTAFSAETKEEVNRHTEMAMDHLTSLVFFPEPREEHPVPVTAVHLYRCQAGPPSWRICLRTEFTILCPASVRFAWVNESPTRRVYRRQVSWLRPYS